MKCLDRCQRNMVACVLPPPPPRGASGEKAPRPTATREDRWLLPHASGSGYAARESPSVQCDGLPTSEESGATHTRGQQPSSSGAQPKLFGALSCAGMLAE